MSGLAPDSHSGPGNWHTLSLTTVGTKASGTLDAKPLFTDIAIRGLDTGFAALGMVDWHAVEFDDFSESDDDEFIKLRHGSFSAISIPRGTCAGIRSS